jgi:hypothetical protein
MRWAHLNNGTSTRWLPGTPPPLGTRSFSQEGDTQQTPLSPELLAAMLARESVAKSRKKGLSLRQKRMMGPNLFGDLP